jgi:1-acyl-sn-glycerol-3-phosphate acyltransferase
MNNKNGLVELLMNLVETSLRCCARWHYRLTVRGVENIPAQVGVLLLPNHVSYVDAIILSLASPRRIRFVSDEAFFNKPVLGWILRYFGGIPISPRRAKEGIQVTAAALSAGEAVCLFPEGKLTLNGELNELRAGFQLIAKQADCQIVVARMDGLWGSVFSYYGGRLFTKLPHRLVRRVTVSFSVPLTVNQASVDQVTKEMRLLQDLAPKTRFVKKSCVNLLFAACSALAISVFYTLTMKDPAQTGLLFAVGGLLTLAVVMALNRIRRCALRHLS